MSTGRDDHRALLQLALTTVEELQARLDAAERARVEPIAIVGVGCRFPGDSDTPEAFWRLLRDGVDAVTEVPPERWDVDAYYDPDPDAPGKSYTRWGAFLKNLDQFDPAFFGISPREATAMDPQHRLLLEVAWESLERAGQSPAQLVGSRTGVFVGLAAMDYAYLQMRHGELRDLDLYFGTGTSHSLAAGRLSYTLDLRGPSVAVDTACSSSLLAVHLACQSLRARESDMALAGGVNVMLCPDGSVATARARMMSFTGRCHTFDAAADGYVRAEGCGLVVLKRLPDAVADRDTVLAVIHGTAVNQDGRSNGLTAPNPQAQERVIRAALAEGRIDPTEVSYLEAHGTGTTLGDPIEMRALGAVFGPGRPADRPLMVGSVKTNIGHLEAAAGIAGLIKVVLALQNRTIPPHLHFKQPNPYIEWDRWPVIVPTGTTAWAAEPGARRVAGLSSFGFSGTNVHMVIAEPPASSQGEEGDPDRAFRVLPLSAETLPALDVLVEAYTRHLATVGDADFANMCFTAGAGRSHFRERLALVAGSAAEAAAILAVWRSARKADGAVAGSWHGSDAPGVAFLFTGQGAQYAGMGAQTYRTEPVFRAALDRCDAILRPWLERPLLEVMFPTTDADRALIDETQYTQPALFAFGYALSQLWRSWGVVPVAVMGHSVGEYTAACVAGVFSLEDGLKLVAARGSLMQALPAGGAMVAARTTSERVRAAMAGVSDQVSIAAVNGPTSTVISGPSTAVSRIVAALHADGVTTTALAVSHAFHSPLMEPMLAAFRVVAASVTFAPPDIDLISNVTGRIEDSAVTSPDYWVHHVRAPVQFQQGFNSLHALGHRRFLEIGPSPVLVGMAAQCIDGDQPFWVPSMRRDHDESKQLATAAAVLYANGTTIDWVAYDKPWSRRKLVQPTYPFQRKRYWLSLSTRNLRGEPLGEELHPLLGSRIRSPRQSEAAFQRVVRADTPTLLGDHRIFDTVVMPAAAYVEMALAGAAAAGAGRHELRDVTIVAPMLLPPDAARILHISLSLAASGEGSFEIQSIPKDDANATWTLHASGCVGHAAVPAASVSPTAVAAARSRCTEDVRPAEFYQALLDIGVTFGPAFQRIEQLHRRDGEVVARVVMPESGDPSDRLYHLHPAILDACLQALGVALPGAADGGAHDVYLPVGFERLQSYRPPGGEMWCVGSVEVAPNSGGQTFVGAFKLLDGHGEIIASGSGLRFKRASRAALFALRPAPPVGDWLYELAWIKEALPAVAAAGGDALGRWLVLTDAAGVGAALAQQLEAHGAGVVLVRAGRVFDPSGPEWTVDAGDPAQLRCALDEAARRDARPLRGVVALWALDAAGAGMAFENITAGHDRLLGSTLALAQALADTTTRLWFVTRGSQPVAGSVPDLVQAPAWGLAGVIAGEFPALRCVRIDLESLALSDEALQLFESVLHPDDEDRVAYRGGLRHVARLIPGSLQMAGSDVPLRLEITDRGTLENLKLRRVEREAPGPGQVEIRVRATGLNFPDVLNALGMSPGDPGSLGSECSGVITSIGEGVDDLKVGDEVVAMVDRSFATWVVAPTELTVRKPSSMTFVEAATIPVTFLTAQYALRDLCCIKKGDRVLIHAITGGVGMAALQLALRAGAEVFGTAGTPAKRALALTQGARHVADSRSLSFAADIMEASRGEGVDIVLNSLAGDFISESLRLLRHGGHFVEIGKTDIWDAARVAGQFPDVHYHPLYLGEVTAARPLYVRGMLKELLVDFEAGVLSPLPHCTYPIERSEEAFRFMGQGHHIGKIVITQDRAPAIRADASYLVTGGFGGLGLVCTRWLASLGARHLLLMGRNSPSPRACQAIAELEAAGVQVTPLLADVSDSAAVSKALAAVASHQPPLRGILHAAGVIDDGMLPEQNMQRFATVMAPKVKGAWNLHTLPVSASLDFFVMFSAGAALLGSPGQGNYAAANSFMDALAHVRRARGQHALSINWGSWAGVGMAADVGEQYRRRWASLGLTMIEPDDGVRMLQEVLFANRTPQAAVLPLVRSRLPANLGPFFAQLLADRPAASTPAAAAAPVDILPRLSAASADERQALLTAFLSEQVVKVLALGASHQVDLHRSLMFMGLDSLMAMELRNRIQTSLNIQLAAADLLQGPSIHKLTADLLAAMTATHGAAAPPALEQQATSGSANTEPTVASPVETWEEGSL